MNDLCWKCPECGYQSPLQEMLTQMECLDCGIEPYKALE